MDTGAEVLGIGATACFVAAALVLVRLHMLPTGREALTSAVSDYGVGAHHRYYRAMVVLLGIGAALLVAGLAREGSAERLGLAFLAAFAAARIAIAFFMTDLPGAPSTTEGRIHVVLAAVAFTTIAFGAGDVTSSVDGAPNWSGAVVDVMRFEARVVAIAAVMTAICFFVPMLRERIFGGVERVLYLASLAWLITTAAHLASVAA